ncbi:MAG: hypothetical protein DME96_05820 [Verrucomicrobia bacterium]|nr:MAG: hypothetical protein DME93_02735 [Verrucomicrobiota bacterium]PYJ17473.1 MAG: hypothetical protein DME96_05820 [Verrucomicrobiota bacterium]
MNIDACTNSELSLQYYDSPKALSVTSKSKDLGRGRESRRAMCNESVPSRFPALAAVVEAPELRRR